MKLCDIQMLPGRIIDMENMADTLNAEDFLLEQLRGQIEDLERQVNRVDHVRPYNNTPQHSCKGA